jgi:cysteate synthase
MYRVTNAEARAAGRRVEKLEGCDIDPAAEVACASLVQAAAMGRIGRGDTVALNITGGGHRRLRRDRRIAFLRPHATFTLKTLRREGPARGLALLRAALA